MIPQPNEEIACLSLSMRSLTWMVDSGVLGSTGTVFMPLCLESLVSVVKLLSAAVAVCGNVTEGESR